MNRNEYLKKLSEALTKSKLPADKRSDIIEDIELHFVEGAAVGKTDETMVASLGDPSILAKAYAVEYATEKVGEKATPRNIFGMIWAALALGLLNVIIGLPIWCLIFAGWVTVFGMGVCMSVAGLVVSIVSLVDWFVPLWFAYVPYHAICVTGGIAVASLSVLVTLASLKLGEWLVKMLLRFFQANYNIITKRKAL